MRINKYLAHEGITTRRGADALIEKGEVFVNGSAATVGQKVEKDDVVEVRGKKEDHRYLAYYKPRGVITHSPASTEEDIAMRIKKVYNLTGLFPIGRLDKDSEGLIILTDDGRITAPLLEHGHEREYQVTVDKKITGAFMNKMESGVNIEGYTTKPTTVTRINQNTFSLILTEGKKHQIRRMCAALGYQVERLARVRIIDIKQNALKPGQFRILKNQELRAFLDTLGVTP